MLHDFSGGTFQGQAPPMGKDPFAIFRLLYMVKRACDAAGASNAQALPLRDLRLSEAAKPSFKPAESSTATRDRNAIKMYGDGLNWLLNKYATPEKVSEAYMEPVNPGLPRPTARRRTQIVNETYRHYAVPSALGPSAEHMRAMHPTLDTGAGLNLIQIEQLPTSWSSHGTKN